MQHLLSDFLTEKGTLLDLGLLRKILTIFFRNSKKLEQDFNYLVPSSALHKKVQRTVELYGDFCFTWGCAGAPGPVILDHHHSQ